MILCRIVVTTTLTFIGLFATPLVLAGVAGSLTSRKTLEVDPKTMTMIELLESEQAVIRKHQAQVEMIGLSSLVGGGAGAILGLTLTRKSKPEQPTVKQA